MWWCAFKKIKKLILQALQSSIYVASISLSLVSCCTRLLGNEWMLVYFCIDASDVEETEPLSSMLEVANSTTQAVEEKLTQAQQKEQQLEVSVGRKGRESTMERLDRWKRLKLMFYHINCYPVYVCAAGLSVWSIHMYIYMCVCVCVTKKTSVLYLAGHNSSQNPV